MERLRKQAQRTNSHVIYIVSAPTVIGSVGRL